MGTLHDVTRGRLLFGGDYNPEQWPREIWDEDLRLMAEAGVNLVTVGVFSWALLEPRPGEYDFGWLDEVLDLLHANGIGVSLATPTATAPPWLHHRWPQTSPQDPDRTVRTYGSRNAYCPSSPVYRHFADAISAKLADRYAHHPALRMWHIGNEFGTVCYCDSCAGAFRDWLRAKYTDLDALNEAWGTRFWSQHYGEWAEVIPPRKVQYVINPLQDQDYQRFASDLLLEGFKRERDLVAARNPAIPVVTNFMGFFKATDSWRWAAEEDFAAVDSYPDPLDPLGACWSAFTHDLTRSLGDASRGGGWIMMEQSTGGVGWRPVSSPKPPGMYRLWSLQAVARGADGVLQFQWRASKQGAERTHSAMVPHAGPDSRVFREVCEVGKDLAGLGDVVGTKVAADVAILLDWDAWRGVELDHQPHSEFTYVDRLLEYYTPLWKANITCDFARPEADLSRYRLVLAPNLYQITDAASRNLERYVEAGGTLVVGPFSGVTDQDERIRLGGYPASLRELLGVRIEEYWPLPAETVLRVRSAELGDFTAGTWAEWFDLTALDADVLATVSGGPLDGHPAVTAHAYGSGTAWYVATLPEPAALAGLLRRIAAQVGAEPVLPDLPEGVEAVRRGERVFLLDHRDGSVEVRPR
ncbi:MAG: beta-galactosidase [Hamadaea sp.]|nr:beta-galactosidase [Hamadaea sp.]